MDVGTGGTRAVLVDEKGQLAARLRASTSRFARRILAGPSRILKTGGALRSRPFAKCSPPPGLQVRPLASMLSA
jgi:hypothetical protein